MKFDLIISNPPYNNSLDLKILESILPLSKNICFVHPIGYLIEKKNSYKLLRDKLEKRLESVKIFNGNTIFNIAIFVECGIVFIKEYSDEIIYDSISYKSIHKINKFGNVEIYDSIEQKIRNYCSNNNIWDKRIKGSDSTLTDKFFISLSGGRAHVEQFNMKEQVFRKNDYYTICSRNLVPTQYRAAHHNWQFETYQEAENFRDFLNTKMARFCLSILKNNMHIDSGELRMVPWLDFTKKYNDKSIAKILNITNNELEWILSQIPNYYTNDTEIYGR